MPPPPPLYLWTSALHFIFDTHHPMDGYPPFRAPPSPTAHLAHATRNPTRPAISCLARPACRVHRATASLSRPMPPSNPKPSPTPTPRRCHRRCADGAEAPTPRTAPGETPNTRLLAQEASAYTVGLHPYSSGARAHQARHVPCSQLPAAPSSTQQQPPPPVPPPSLPLKHRAPRFGLVWTGIYTPPPYLDPLHAVHPWPLHLTAPCSPKTLNP